MGAIDGVVVVAGYSGTPLAKKLGIAEDMKVVIVGEPQAYRNLLDLPKSVTFASTFNKSTDLVQHFTTKKSELARALKSYRSKLRPDAVVWVSWPKKAAKVPTDITEDVVREVALPLGFVDVKVCAIDETWSGLKLVVRKELR
jgi:6-phosphogluconate dehydrogenase (decarboxylating)